MGLTATVFIFSADKRGAGRPASACSYVHELVSVTGFLPPVRIVKTHPCPNLRDYKIDVIPGPLRDCNVVHSILEILKCLTTVRAPLHELFDGVLRTLARQVAEFK